MHEIQHCRAASGCEFWNKAGVVLQEGEDAESEAPVQQLSHLPQLSPQGQLSLAGTKLATVPDEVLHPS